MPQSGCSKRWWDCLSPVFRLDQIRLSEECGEFVACRFRFDFEICRAFLGASFVALTMLIFCKIYHTEQISHTRQFGRVVQGAGSRRQSARAWARTPQLSFGAPLALKCAHPGQPAVTSVLLDALLVCVCGGHEFLPNTQHLS